MDNLLPATKYNRLLWDKDNISIKRQKDSRNENSKRLLFSFRPIFFWSVFIRRRCLFPMPLCEPMFHHSLFFVSILCVFVESLAMGHSRGGEAGVGDSTSRSIRRKVNEDTKIRTPFQRPHFSVCKQEGYGEVIHSKLKRAQAMDWSAS